MSEMKAFEVALRVCSFERPAEDIASRLPIKASRLIEKDSQGSITGNRRIVQDSRWILDSGIPDATPLEHQIDYFVRLFEKNKAAFKKLPDDCEIDLWCTVFSLEEFTGFSLDRILIQKLAEYRVGVVFSIYTDSPAKAR